MIIVWLFLKDFRATLIALLAIPVSIVATFAVFPLAGFTINTLTLFALILAIGLVVDDAIVVIEIVERNLERGMEIKEATLKAMQEIQAYYYRHSQFKCSSCYDRRKKIVRSRLAHWVK